MTTSHIYGTNNIAHGSRGGGLYQIVQMEWTTSDLKINHDGIKLWAEEFSNVLGPIEFKIGKNCFPENNYDVIFTANTFHIMGWKEVKLFIKLCGQNLSNAGFKLLMDKEMPANNRTLVFKKQ